MNTTAISWTHRPGTRGRTWNPVRGCQRVSEGCRHCYAERQAERIVRMGKGRSTPYDGLVKSVNGEARWTGAVTLDPERLAAPLHWREPSTVFVDSMSDLFYSARPNEDIAAVYGMMAACPQHTFIVLTKYARRMREWFATPGIEDLVERFRCIAVAGRIQEYSRREREMLALAVHDEHGRVMQCRDGVTPWPPPWVWNGVSVENQDAADERIPELLATSAAVRFLSCEPLLGPVDLTLRGSSIKGWDEDWKYDTLRGAEWANPHSDVEDGSSTNLDWVIAGCESGPGARRCDVAWLRSLRNQCAAANVPFFLKQARAVPEAIPAPDGAHPSAVTTYTTSGQRWIDIVAAGNGSKPKRDNVIENPYLDGVQHIAFPAIRKDAEDMPP